MGTVRIYKLINPIDNHVFYVGKTVKSLEQRLYAHIKDKEANKRKREIIAFIISKGMKPVIELIESIVYNNNDEEISALLREDFWIKEYSKKFDLCNGSGVVKPRLLNDYSKETKKTKPCGVRFNIDEFEFIKKNENLETAQQVVYFLMNEYMKLFRKPRVFSEINNRYDYQKKLN